MIANRRRFISILALTASSMAFTGREASTTQSVRWEGVAFGGACSITIAGETRRRAEAAIAAAAGEIERMEDLFSLFRTDSELSRLNRAGYLSSPSPDVLHLFALCDIVHSLTGDAFDPTIQPLWRLYAETAGRPDSRALCAARDRIGWRQVQFDLDAIAFKRDGMAVTLNGIAQGYATDRVADTLKAHGLAAVLVNIGEIAAIGSPAPGRPWRVGIAERADGVPEEETELTDMAIATSSPFGTVLDAEGAIGHIVEPRSSRTPAGWRRISVIHRSAALADGLSTGFCLMQRNEIEIAAERAGARVILR